MGDIVKSYKGFNKDMSCRNFKYEEGKEYTNETAKVCHSGFHACEYPLDCFSYYNPNQSVFHEVEQSGELSKSDDDTKVASSKIKIGASISIAGLVKAAIEYTSARTKKEKDSTGAYGASAATGACGASSATGAYGASSATGAYGASAATGDCGASSATGAYGASSATGYKGASSATGACGASSATGACGASSATGACGASAATGYKSTSSAGDRESIAIAWGYKSKAKGVLGSYLVFADWEGDENNFNNPEKWTLKGAKMVQVDGDKVKPDTWYEIENGEIKEADNV